MKHYTLWLQNGSVIEGVTDDESAKEMHACLTERTTTAYHFTDEEGLLSFRCGDVVAVGTKEA